MSGYTHAAVGANAVWIAVFLGVVIDERAIIFVVAGALAALLPDIDARNAKIHSVGGGVLSVFRGAFAHRGFFHSMLAVGMVFVLSFVFLREHHFLLPYVITLGYASHLFIDGFNFKGVQYFFPFKKMFHVVPKFLASPVRGIADQLFFVVGASGIALFFLLHHQSFASLF